MMINKVKTSQKRLKIFLSILCLAIFIIKIFCDCSPFFALKNAFADTAGKYKTGLSDIFLSNSRIMVNLSYESNGKIKKLHTFFEDSLIGFTVGKSDDVYYTIPVDNIMSMLNSKDLNEFFCNIESLPKSVNSVFVIPALLSLDFNKNLNIKSLIAISSEINLIDQKNSLLSFEKSFSYAVSSKTLTKAVDLFLSTETDDAKKIKSHLKKFISSKKGDYLFNIDVDDNMLKRIICITPNGGDYPCFLQIDLNYPSLSLCVGMIKDSKPKSVFALRSKIYNNLDSKAVELSLYGAPKSSKSQKMVLNLFPDTKLQNRLYKEKSIYSLTLGELFRLGKELADM